MKQIKHSFLLAMLMCGTLSLAAQKNFTPALWTKPDGSQEEILIDFQQWETAPLFIDYKTAGGGPIQQLQPHQVRILRVMARSEEIYVGRDVEVAIFSQSPSISAEVNFRRKLVFLRALVLGSLNLYKYQDEDGLSHYFIEKEGTMEELIYHEFYMDETQKQTRRHHRYRTQLLRATYGCSAIVEKIQKMNFGERSLVGVVAEYNSATCGGQGVFEEQRSKAKFKIGIRAGGAATLNSTGFTIASFRYTGQNTIKAPKYGASIAVFLPRRRGSVALLLDVMNDRQQYVVETPISAWTKENYWQFHFSMRRYWLSKTLNPFLNAGILFGTPVGDTEFSRGFTPDFTPRNQGGFSIGGGVRWGRLELETRFSGNTMINLGYNASVSSYTAQTTLCFWVN